jgi:predicted amidophosphoribosyltransferase
MIAPKTRRKAASDKPGLRRRFFTTKLCPNCLNELKPINQLSGLVTPEGYYCEKCGYTGSVALERIEDEPEE